MKAPRVGIERRAEGYVVRAEIWREEGTAAASIATVPHPTEQGAVEAFSLFVSDLLVEPIRRKILSQLMRELANTREVLLSPARTRRNTPRG
jgi:Na+/alanine symporter